MELCKHCSHIVNLESPPSSPASYRHYKTLAELQQSSQRCLLCRGILRGIEKAPLVSKELLESGSIIGHFRVKEEGAGLATAPGLLRRHGILTMTVRGFLARSAGAWIPPIMDIMVKRPDVPPRVPSFNRLLPPSLNKGAAPASLDNLGSRAIWTTGNGADVDQQVNHRLSCLRTWVGDCRKSHPKCRIPDQLPRPTRLLDVGVSTDPGQKIVLVSTNSPEQKIRRVSTNSPEPTTYNTLSHCWGSGSHLNACTTRDNLADRLSGIEVSSLPKTYQEAIRTTRALGIHHLWIDSLCIIQDDKQDWELESSRMSDIYRGAFLTLAATGATSPAGGLFLTPAEENRFTVPLDGRSRDGGQSYAVVRAPAAGIEHLHAAPLNTRAWTLQELVLSSRTAHFLEDQMYWQCRTLLLSEDGLVCHDKFSSLRFWRVLDRQLDLRKEEHRVWWFWVLEYSCRELTVRTDWLAALAGITQHFADETARTPVLGLWRETLVTDLGWHVNPDAYSDHGRGYNHWDARYAAVPDIPSWSWMKMQLAISVPLGALNQLKKVHTKVREVRVGWTGRPLTSAIASSKLVLSGPVKTLEFQPRITLALDRRNGCRLRHHDDGICYTDEPAFGEDTLDGEPFSSPCLLLAAYRKRRRRDAPGPEPEYALHEVFLVLKVVGPAAGGAARYRRIGAGEIVVKAGMQSPFLGVKSETLELV